MIHRLTLGNFKPFRDTHEAPLAPITLVYGPNSAGKSSLIQSLLLLKQTFQEPDGRDEETTAVLRPNGQWTQLGSWASLLNRHDTSRHLVLGLEIPWSPTSPTSPSATGIDRFLADSAGEFSLDLRMEFRRYDDTPDVYPPFLDRIRYSIQLGDAGPFTFTVETPRQSGFLGGECDIETHYMFGAYDWASRDDALSFADFLVRLRERWTAWLKRLLQESTDRPRGTSWRELLFEDIQTKGLSEQLRHYYFSTRHGFPFDPTVLSAAPSRIPARRTIQMILSSLADAFRAALRDTAYLGPLRVPPSRVIHGLDAPASTASSGEDAIRRFCKIADYWYDSLDQWFDRLELPYRLRARKLPSEIFGDLYALVLTDKRTGVEVAPTEVGFGIGQLLPILLEGMHGHGSTILIEQPEIHVHPKLQAHLADFFIDTSGRRSSQWIVETHSEALMLRLQRRIREGKLSPDDVAVLYVEPGEEGSRILHLRLAEDGEFIDEWPEGFFEERYDEMFGGEE